MAHWVVETERTGMRELTAEDRDSVARLDWLDTDRVLRRCVEQMKEDEGHHATVAKEAGGTELPAPIKNLMGLSSKIMTRTAFWL